jgi:hypothetical protein
MMIRSAIYKIFYYERHWDSLSSHDIVTNWRVVWLIYAWVLDWTLDCFDTCRLQHLWFRFHSGDIVNSHNYSLYSTAISQLQFTITRTESSWFAVPLVVGYRLPTAVPKLSPRHSHNTWLTVLSLGFCQIINSSALSQLTDSSELSPITTSTGPLSSTYFTGTLTTN